MLHHFGKTLHHFRKTSLHFSQSLHAGSPFTNPHLTPQNLHLRTRDIEVKLDGDSVWLNRSQMALLFGRDVKIIGKHINNVFSEGELIPKATVANFATVQIEGGREIERRIEQYNLDVVISVRYRVKSQQGTHFRIWATNVLRDYLLKGYAFNQRMNRIENNYEHLRNEVKQISLQLKTQKPSGSLS